MAWIAGCWGFQIFSSQAVIQRTIIDFPAWFWVWSFPPRDSGTITIKKFLGKKISEAETDLQYFKKRSVTGTLFTMWQFVGSMSALN